MPDPKPTPPPSKRFTGKDLAKAVTPAVNLPKDAVALKDPDAEQILADRMSALAIDPTDVTASGSTVNFRDIAEVIIDALPADLHNETTLRSIDLRPYMQAVAGKKILTRQLDYGPLPGTNVHHQNEGVVGKVDSWVQAETVNVGAKGGAAAFRPDVATAVIPVADKPAAPGAATPGSGTAAPGSAPGATPSAGTGSIVIDPSTGQPIWQAASGAASSSQFNVEGLRAAVQSGVLDLQNLAVQESNYKTDNPTSTDYFPVQMNADRPQGDRQTISTLDAMRYLQNVTPDEVHNMQLKMAAAGYFDRLDNGGAYLDGDAFDKNTQAAWELVLADSIKSNQSVPAVLGTNLSTYREQVRQERLKQLSSFDPTYSRTLANDYAQSVIGKDLTPAQLDSLELHLHGLVNQRAGYVAGADSGGAGPLPNDPRGQGFTKDDVQLAAEADPGFNAERRHKNDLSLEFKLRQLMH